LKHVAVKNTCVFGKQNSVLGNILCCEVELYNSQKLTEKEIRDFLSTNLQDFKIPRIIKFVDEIRITKTGKVKRS